MSGDTEGGASTTRCTFLTTGVMLNLLTRDGPEQLARTFTHVIDEQSPLWPYRDNVAEAHGQVMIHICGNDRHLNTEFCDAWLYNLPDVCHRGRHRWADLMDGTNVDGRPVGADLSKIDDVLHLEDEGGVETAKATFFG